MLRPFTAIVLVLFVALNIKAQDDEDISYSINLPETMILADGMTFEEYLVKQVLANVYDQFYKKVREKAKELKKKYRKKQDTGMEYVGSYTAGNRTFYIVKLENMRVHIAEGCWQISRISYVEGQNNMSYEFKEVRPNLFLLSRGTAKLFLDKTKWPKGFISMKMGYDYQ